MKSRLLSTCMLIMAAGCAVSPQQTENPKGTITFLRLAVRQPCTVDAIDVVTGECRRVVTATENGPHIRTFQYSPDGTQFVIDMGNVPKMDIYLGETKSGKLRRLTDGMAYNAAPAFSRSGKRIAFAHGDPRQFQIIIYDLDSGRKQSTPLPPGSMGTTDPQWVGDKDLLICVALAHLDPANPDTLNNTLAEIDLRNESGVIFYKNPHGLGRERLSPDNTRLACIVQKSSPIAGELGRWGWMMGIPIYNVVGPEYGYRIHIIDMATKRLRAVDGGPGPTERDGSLDWSPDGTRLAWLRGRKNKLTKLKIHDFEKHRTRTISLPEPATEAGPMLQWSPDGDYIACLTSSNKRAEHNLLLVSVRDGSTRKVHTDNCTMQLCDWR